MRLYLDEFLVKLLLKDLCGECELGGIIGVVGGTTCHEAYYSVVLPMYVSNLWSSFCISYVRVRICLSKLLIRGGMDSRNRVPKNFPLPSYKFIFSPQNRFPINLPIESKNMIS